MVTDYKKETPESLKKSLMTLREELRTARFEAEGSRRRNVREGRGIRKNIARIQTELRARQIAENAKTA